MLLNVEPCHPLYNRTVDFVFFLCRDRKTLQYYDSDIVGKLTGTWQHSGASPMFTRRTILEIEIELFVLISSKDYDQAFSVQNQLYLRKNTTYKHQT